MSVELSLATPQSQYLIGEDIGVDVLIRNRGSTPVQIPDPESNVNWLPNYELRGPEPTTTRRFDFRSIVRRRLPQDSGDAELITLPAQSTHAASLPLSRLVPLGRPGSYSLSARLDWGEIRATSAPVTFALESLEPHAVDVGLSWRGDGVPEIYALCLHKGRGQPALLQGIFGEDRPDLGEVGRRAVARIAAPATGTTRVFAPWAAHSRLDDLIGWALWSEGSQLCGTPTMGGGPLRMTLPFAPSCVALPLLESRAHTVDAFIVGGAEARTVAMVRIEHGGLLRPPTGRVVWTWDCPEAIVAAAACARSSNYERIRHLALLSASAGTITVRHACVDGTHPPGRFSASATADCRPVPSTPPAVFAHADGSVRVAVMTDQAHDPSRCQLVEFRFGAGGGAATPTVTASGVLPVPGREGRIQYYGDAVSGVYRCVGVVRGTNGATYALTSTGRAEPVLPQQLAPAPLALIALRSHSYVLDREPSGALRFVHV